MALTRTENIGFNGNGGIEALRAATEEIGDLLVAKLPGLSASSAGLVAGQDASSTTHIREAWSDFDDDGRVPETGSILVSEHAHDGFFDVFVSLVFDVKSLHVTGNVSGFKRGVVKELAGEIRTVLKRHLS